MSIINIKPTRQVAGEHMITEVEGEGEGIGRVGMRTHTMREEVMGMIMIMININININIKLRGTEVERSSTGDMTGTAVNHMDKRRDRGTGMGDRC